MKPNRLQQEYIETVKAHHALSGIEAASMMLHCLKLGKVACDPAEQHARDLGLCVLACERMMNAGRYSHAEIRGYLKQRAFFKRIEATTANAFDYVMSETQIKLEGKGNA